MSFLHEIASYRSLILIIGKGIAIRTCEGGVSFFSVSLILTRDFRDLPNVIGPNIYKFSIFKGRVLFCISNS